MLPLHFDKPCQAGVLAPVIDKPIRARTYHGETIEDPYMWLEENSEKTNQWLEQQQRHCQPFLTGKATIEWLNKRYDELCRIEEISAPGRVKNSERLFFTCRSPDKDRDIWLTKKNADAPFEVLLDPNEWSSEKSLDFCSFSDDGRYVAYGVSSNGDENPVVRILDLETKQHLPDTLQGWRTEDIVWLPDNYGFYYTAHPLKGTVPEGEEEYWNSCYFHRLESDGKEDRKIFGSTVKEDYHGAFVNEEGTFELFTRATFSKDEFYFRPYGSKEAPRVIVAGNDAKNNVEIYKNTVFIMTDLNAPKSRLAVASIDLPTPEHWKDIIPEKENAIMKNFNIFEGRLYVEWLENAFSRVTIHSLDGTYLRDLPTLGIGTMTLTGFQDKKKGIQVTFESYTQPRMTFLYDFESNASQIIKESRFKVDQSLYETKQVWYHSKDGTKVSMFVLTNVGIKLDGSNPVLLYGYGGFDCDEVPVFSTTYLAWLEAGGAVACPNIRGGGEYGREWHENGTREHKQNVFDDFIAAAEYLIANNYTNPQRLAIAGGSNGGLLVGAVMTQRPDLFKAVLCQVPLLDMLNYHKWGLANIWEDEFGSSEDPQAFAYLRKYSPYHTIRENCNYPAVLFTASADDARVKACHAMKMAARLQEVSHNPVVLSYQTASGHAGGTTFTQQFRQSAEQYGFLMDQLNMKIPDVGIVNGMKV